MKTCFLILIRFGFFLKCFSVFAIFCGVSGFGIEYGFSDENSPKILVKDKNFNFGKANQNEKIPHVFHFENIGSGILRVRKVRSSCGCTAALATKKELDPGEKGDINVTFSTGSMEGHKSKTVFLHTNDPGHPVTEFKITGVIMAKSIQNSSYQNSSYIDKAFPGEDIIKFSYSSDLSSGKVLRPEKNKFVQDLIIPSPASVDFYAVVEGISIEKEVLIRGKTPFLIAGERTTLPFLSIENKQENKSLYKLSVKLSEKAPVGRFLGSIILYTDNSFQPSVIIRVSGRVIPKDETVFAVSQ
ncbi:MAG: DUF1573 domain-containing protein [Candidatus Theseobacter exili]|nr:DUF1573 domain-containing protein [Candidatus Theseobacter exili]